MRNDPRQIEARFNSTCSGCGKEIKKGDKIYYWPLNKKAYCACGESDYLKSMSAIMQEDQGVAY